MAILDVQHIEKSFGATKVLKDINFSLCKCSHDSILFFWFHFTMQNTNHFVRKCFRLQSVCILYHTGHIVGTFFHQRTDNIRLLSCVQMGANIL